MRPYDGRPAFSSSCVEPQLTVRHPPQSSNPIFQYPAASGFIAPSAFSGYEVSICSATTSGSTNTNSISLETQTCDHGDNVLNPNVRQSDIVYLTEGEILKYLGLFSQAYSQGTACSATQSACLDVILRGTVLVEWRCPYCKDWKIANASLQDVKNHLLMTHASHGESKNTQFPPEDRGSQPVQWQNTTQYVRTR
ncbi:hypothetical protein NM688_g8532 [Phlebia brevispora]|uniref:Uncharacterized protein n=1 Tax=Phlebia brevispora TaxID=194682 RepID=A0ACC1RQD1_9APHY|nr:hypothetical protein NM688_g8532 [Phlebia brevispora]